MLIALFFLILSLSLIAEDRADNWYQIGYDYSQQGQNNKAFYYMLKAANFGHVVAQNNIGLSYLHGLGVEKDKNKAFYWFEKAAKQGLSYAQSELAMLYYQKGRLQQAQDWWLFSAKQNDEYAQFNLASLFLEKNAIKQAHYWLTRAKNNNHPNAENALEKLSESYVR